MSDILMVCEGNTCRSPYAEYYLRHALGPAATKFTVSSRGVRAVVGEPMDPKMAGLLGQDGGPDIHAHRARQVTVEDLRDAALVLTGTRRIRSTVVGLYAPAVQYSFTLRQFGEMLAAAVQSDLSPTSLRAENARAALAGLVAAVRSATGVVPTRAVGDDDVIDPVGRDLERYRQAIDEMRPAVRDLAEVLRTWSTPTADRAEGPLEGIPTV